MSHLEFFLRISSLSNYMAKSDPRMPTKKPQIISVLRDLIVLPRVRFWGFVRVYTDHLAVLNLLKVFILTILLLSWQSFFDLDKSSQYDIVEYYAGIGRISRLGAAYGYTAGAFDVVYDFPEFTESMPGPKKTKFRKYQTNKRCAMDLTTSSGFMFLGYFSFQPVIMFHIFAINREPTSMM